MKKSLIVLIAIVSLIIIGGITYFVYPLLASSNTEDVYFPFRTEAYGRWGIMKYDGTIIFEEEFEEEPISPRNERFFIKNDDDYINIYTLEEKPRQIGDDYLDIAPFTENVTPATTEGNAVTLIDKNGKVVKTLDKINNCPVIAVSEFRYGYAGVCITKDADELFGIINTKGDVVVNPAYEDILIKENAFVALSNNEEKLTIISYGGKILFETNLDKYQDYKTLDKYFALNKSNEKWEIFNYQGKLINDQFKAEIKDIVDNIVIYKKNGDYGLMKLDGEIITRNKYEILLALGEERFLGLVDDKVEFFDKEGNVLMKNDQIRDITKFVNGKILVEEGKNNWVLMNKNFEDLKNKNLYKIYEIETEHDKKYKWVESDYLFQYHNQDGIKYKARTFTVNGVSFDMVKVKGGTFTMGATAEQGDDAWYEEKPAHQVTLSSYSIGQTEVTQALWKAVMGNTIRQQKDKVNTSWSIIGEGDDYPMYYISWDNCQEFIQKLNQITGQNFRLPTEAEWEFAARGGKQSKGHKYAGSNNIDDVAWYDDNSNGQTHPVATKLPNELGIYDMNGNVDEWCQDWKGSYSSSSQTNPQGPSSGSRRVLRGGSWGDISWLCRVSHRGSYSPDGMFGNFGFRLCL